MKREDWRDGKNPKKKEETGATAKTFPNKHKTESINSILHLLYRLRRRGIKQYTVAGC